MMSRSRTVYLCHAKFAMNEPIRNVLILIFTFIFIFMLVLRHTPPLESSQFQRHKIKHFYCIKFHFAVKTWIQALRIIFLRVMKQSTAILCCYCVSRTAIRPIIQTAPGTCKKICETTRQHKGNRRKYNVTSSKHNIRAFVMWL
jgi:hypothetical protein